MPSVDLSGAAIAFGLGLAGSLHCAQMCGPIVLAFRGGHFFYHLGRILTYSVLGAVAGAVGGLGRLAVAERVVFLAAGLLLILAGLLMTRRFGRIELVRIGSGGALGAISRRAGRFLLSPRPASKLLLGLGLGFLPCGLIYAALIQAMGTGDALSGAAAMAAFGVGTAASLVAIGVFSTAIRGRFGGSLPRWVPAACMMLAGLVLVWRGVSAHTHPPEGGSCHVHHRG